MLLLTDITLTLALALVRAIDWIADRFEREDDIPEFLRDDYRPIQTRGRPRRLT